MLHAKKSEALFILDQSQDQLCEFVASMLADELPSRGLG